MSGLFESLSSTSNALVAQRMGLDVVGQNIANLNTPGYARRTLVLAEVPPADALSAGRGVTAVDIRAMRDALVDARLRREQGGNAREAVMADILSTVESVVGLPGTSIDSALTAFFDTFSTLASDPLSGVFRDNVVRQGTRLASAFHDMAGQFETVRTDANASIRDALSEVNRLATELASLNVGMATNSYEAESIQDRQGVILARLSELAGVSVLTRSDGGVDVTLASGRAIVIGESAFPLEASPTGMVAVSLGGVDVTTELTGGRIGGLIDLRDRVISGYLTQLDRLASDLGTAVNATHQAGFDASGAAGGAFFALPTGVAGAASTITIDPALLADSRLVAASATGVPGDNGTARLLAALRNAPVAGGGTKTPFAEWSAMVYGIGSDVASARVQAASHTQIVTQLQALQAQTSGVSYDEEAAHLMRYQRAYEANARYFTTIVDTLDVLMDMVH